MEVVSPEDVREVSDEELTRRVFDRQRHLDQQRAIQAVEIAEWRNRGLWATDGSKTAASHFARETGISTPTAKHLFTGDAGC